MQGVDKKKIVEKLQQIQGYIQQTTAAMAALEQQGDIVCISPLVSSPHLSFLSSCLSKSLSVIIVYILFLA